MDEMNIAKDIVTNLGLPGAVIFFLWRDSQKIVALKTIIDNYEREMQDTRQFIEHIFIRFENVCKDLKDVIIHNTQVLTRVDERTRGSEREKK